RDCPWCGIESNASVRLFNFLLHGADSQRGHFRLDEIWKEIEAIQPPIMPLAPRDKTPMALEPSAEVAAFVRERRKRFIISLGFSAVAGLLISLSVDFPLAFFLLVLAGLAASAIAKPDQTSTGKMQVVFQRRPAMTDDPFVKRVESLRQEAENKTLQIEARWKKEAGDERFLTRLFDLQNQKETYENLAQIRDFKLKQLESKLR